MQLVVSRVSQSCYFGEPQMECNWPLEISMKSLYFGQPRSELILKVFGKSQCC